MLEHADNRYSRFVALAKVILPLAALALLSTLFLIARGPGTTGPVPYADGTVDDLALEPRLTSPHYAGVTQSGARITLDAGEARPTGDSAYTVDRLGARIERPSGQIIEITAQDGTIDPAARTARLTGLARVTATGGYALETTGLDAALDTGRVVSHGAVAGRAPEGTLAAGQMIVEPAGDGANAQLLFSGGVKLVYLPQQGE